VECRWTDRPLQIDGDGKDDAWKRAAVIDGFGMPWLPTEQRRPKTKTQTRLLWDRENLYFLAEMEDRDLMAQVTEPDGPTWHDDVIELFLKPADNKPGYYELQVNPAGTRLDMFLPQRSGEGYERYRKDGVFNWETKVTLHGTLNRNDDRDRGWTVEGRIPWTDLLRTGGRPAVNELWKMAFCRYDYHADGKPELSTSAPLTRSAFHQYEDYSPVRFLGPEAGSARQTALPGWTPVTTSKVVGSPDPPDPYRARRLYPNLKLTYPETVVREPGSDRLLALIQRYPGGPTTLIRFQDRPDVDRFEELLSVDQLGYDLTFHPDFAKNGYLYYSMRGPFSAPDAERRVSVVRYTLSQNASRPLDPASATPILSWLSNGHDGAAMGFDRDGLFYVTSGDGTSDSDLPMRGQDMSLLLSKLLRLDVDHPAPGQAYGIPRDNPFVGMPGVRPETWAYGFRNPWRMTVDRENGQIWVGNNGQDLWEQAYLVEKGANYGWSVFEGSHEFYANRKLGPTPHVAPTVEHPHSEARSLTGGVVYHGQHYPELRGAYIYGDYSTGKIWGVKHDGQKILWHRELADTTLQITGFGTDSHGELLVVDMRGNGEGGFYTLEPTPKQAGPSTFPRTLSESGLFAAVKGHRVASGLIPYDVNAPLWSDNAYKERFIALPGADAKIDVTDARGWNFPDQTVLVKSFALEQKEGDPKSRRWVETRFLTKQEGEWVGYSYQWNEAQTDATLVEAKGGDREYAIRVPRSADNPEGVRKQTWHYPSRAECMACHSRAANFALGLTTLQMNREHAYGKVKQNQLQVLERLGVLRLDWNNAAHTALRDAFKAKGLDENAANVQVDQHSPRGDQRPVASASLLPVTPDRIPHLADPYDKRADLTARAKSYLQANCANCHIEAGGGNAQMELEFTTPLEKMRIFDTRPVHDAFGITSPRLIAPGAPERSVLLKRLSHRDKGHMPPLATSRVDERAVQLMEEWIRSLK
jgi:glucose/arabinose dehydrogenase